MPRKRASRNDARRHEGEEHRLTPCRSLAFAVVVRVQRRRHIDPRGSATRGSATRGSATRVEDPQSEALPANRDEIFARYEAAVKEVTQAAEAAAKTELEQLAAQVAGLDAVARKAREVARMKLRSDEAEAEGVRRETSAKARAECEARLDGIRADFHAALVPINAEVALARARQEAALRGAVRACADLRDEQLAALAEAERLDAKVDMVTEDYTNAPARTAG